MVTKTRARVYEEIDRGSALSSDLRAQKNSRLPIFRLPPEILANIFTHGARDYYESDDEPTSRVPHWVNVSYVCHHWRNVALNCLTLWTYHFTLSPRWSEELLTRSKQASLKICIYIGSLLGRSKWPRLLEKMLNHAERIEELRLDIPADVLPSELSLNAPRLQILDICIWRVWDRHSKQTFLINNGDTLPLRTLKLTACPLPWNSTFNLSGVITLFLCDIPSPSQLPIMEFLATLSGMQALEVLHLDRSLASSCGFLSSGAFGASQKVSLPRLARLFVAGPLSTVVVLLSCINILVKTPVKLIIDSENSSSVDDYAQIPPALAQRFCQYKDLPSSHPPIRSLTISIGFQSTFTISASELDDYDPRLSKPYPPWDCSPPLIIIVGMEQLIPIRDHIMSDICCSIPSTHVQTLHLIDPPFSSDFWRKVLGHLDGLRRMKLGYGLMPDLASLLALAPGDITDPTLGHTFVPALEELELYRITFAYVSGNAITEKALLDALSTRKARLTMTQCD